MECCELEAELRILKEVRGPGTCQCSDDDACRYVRERDAAMSEVERLRSGLTALAMDAEANGRESQAGTILLFRDGQIVILSPPAKETDDSGEDDAGA